MKAGETGETQIGDTSALLITGRDDVGEEGIDIEREVLRCRDCGWTN